MSESLAKLPGDEVPGFDPITFAVAFVRAMRKQATAAHRPSLRTSIAIPRLLCARCLRAGGLTPNDYVTAAVRCTPPEDQSLARAIARSLVFPEAAPASDATVRVPRRGAADSADDSDGVADILSDLAAIDVDLDAISDLTDLEPLMDNDQEGEQSELGAFELFEALYSSADPRERALGELVHHFGGPAELEASGIRTRFLLQVWLARQVLGAVGELTPTVVAWGVQAGFGPDLKRACRQPWEVAGVLAGLDDESLPALLDDLLQGGSSSELGRTLAFLGPHPSAAPRRDAMAEAALARALELTDFAELVVGLGEWIDPPAGLIDASVAVNPGRALEAARWLEAQFGMDLRTDVFVAWHQTQSRPDFGQLALMAVSCEPWEHALAGALAHEVAQLDHLQPATAKDPVDPRLEDAVKLAEGLVQTGFDAGQTTANALATEAMVRVPMAGWFLPLLDAFLARGATPKADPLLKRAAELGVPEEEVLDRLGKALEQLRIMVLSDSDDVDRYQRLVVRIQGMPQELMAALCASALANRNLLAMAALLAVDLGAAAAHLPEDQVANALGHKGIGDGPNLLKQWFTHRGRVSPSLRDRIKAQVKAALLDQAFDWMGKGDGSGSTGLVPQQQIRPFRAGDNLDALDLEGTLESIVTSGRGLDQLTEEDLFAADTARGRAAMVVLIDISGSMGGGELAVCAIAVVMLLGRLLPQEIALAVFESSTHVIKDFSDPTDLDQVADQVLELEADGGTRGEAALSWASRQFATVPEAHTRVLFMLSDFALWEGPTVLRPRGQALAAHGARLLAASHGYVDREVLTILLETIGGEHLKMKRIDRLPQLLLTMLTHLTDGR